jgi:hypothetical protein
MSIGVLEGLDKVKINITPHIVDTTMQMALIASQKNSRPTRSSLYKVMPSSCG